MRDIAIAGPSDHYVDHARGPDGLGWVQLAVMAATALKGQYDKKRAKEKEERALKQEAAAAAKADPALKAARKAAKLAKQGKGTQEASLLGNVPPVVLIGAGLALIFMLRKR